MFKWFAYYILALYCLNRMISKLTEETDVAFEKGKSLGWQEATSFHLKYGHKEDA